MIHETHAGLGILLHLRARPTSPHTRKLGSVLARGAAVLPRAVVATAVVLPVARCAVGAVAAGADAGGPLGAHGLFVCGWHDFVGEVQPVRETGA